MKSFPPWVLRNYKVFIFVPFITIFFTCQQNDEANSLGIEDTVRFYVNLTAGGKPYVFNFRPGNDDSSNASQVYRNTGSHGYDASFTWQMISRYIEIVDKEKNVSLKIGFYFRPGAKIEVGSDDECEKLEDESDKYFVPKSYPICDSSGSGEFLACANTNEDEFYFQVEFIDVANAKRFKSGIQVMADSFFRIDGIQKLSYLDRKVSTGSFSLVIQGEFNITMHEYKTGTPDDPNAESLTMENTKFKIGIKDLCVN